MTLSHMIFALLVAIAAAAPVAEQTANQEQVVNVNGDSNVDRAKRAKEEIVFGNQQNGARLGGPAKKSFDPPFLVGGAPAMPDVPLAMPELMGKVYKEKNVEEIVKDKSGKIYAKEEKVIVPMEGPAAIVEEVGKEAPEIVEEVKEEVFQPLEGGLIEAGEDIKVVRPEAELVVEEGAAAPEEDNAPGVPVVDAFQPVPSGAAEAEMAGPAVPILPETSEKADAEEDLHGKVQTTEDQDEVESFLKELNTEGQKQGDDQEEEVELKETANQKEEGVANEAEGKDEYSSLLKYILMKGNDYAGSMPVNYPAYPYNYYNLRRRRSLAHHRHLARLQQRRAHGVADSSSNKGLARAKRTKRDLFDDDLYYNSNQAPLPTSQDLVPALYQPDPALAQAIAEQEANEENEADLEQLITYLMALYPSLYGNNNNNNNNARGEGASGLSQLPGYMWYGAGYPQDSGNYYPEWVEEEEEVPEYVEVPAPGWGPEPTVLEAAPAWEPTFYPEEVLEQEEEEPTYYPSMSKRQMLSFVPGQRRKRYFYPFSYEPYTHWGAFVPDQEKRDYYDNAVRRLRNLAMALADSRPQEPSAYDAFSDYKKK